MENIKYNKKSRTEISRSVPWPRAKTMPLDEPAKMIMNRFSIIENYLICNDKQWTNFSIGFLRLKRRFPWFNAVPDRSGCIDACREGRIKLNIISRNICQISNWLWQFENRVWDFLCPVAPRDIPKRGTSDSAPTATKIKACNSVSNRLSPFLV